MGKPLPSRPADAGKCLVDRIRAFQKSAQANKKCADCVERGPTYICLDFHTFVCQACSGIHREFAHKIKSVSLSEWTVAEVEAIEAGGNERAAQKWLARWKSEEYPEPDHSEMDKIRENIKFKYVEKRWFQMPASDGADPKDQRPANGGGEQPASPTTAKPAVNTTDLLSDGGASPLAAPPAPVAAVRSAAAAAAAPPQASARPADQPEWTADFGAPAAFDAWAGGGAGAGLFDLDFSEPAPAASLTGSAPATSSSAPPPAEDMLDLFASPERSTGQGQAEPAEEPAPTSAAAGGAVDGKGGAADEASSISDQMRKAVLSGSQDELKRLFQQCLEEPQKKPVSPSRLAAFAAFDDMLDCDGGGAVPEAPTSPLEASAESVAAAPPAKAAASAAALPAPAPAPPLPAAAPAAALPAPAPVAAPAAAPAGGASSGGAQMFFIGDDAEAQLERSIEEKLTTLGEDLFSSSAGSSAPSSAQVPRAGSAQQQPAAMTPSQLAQLMPQAMPQKSDMMSPQQLEHLSPQDLMQMQMMISRALQARTQVAPPVGAGWPPVPAAGAAEQRTAGAAAANPFAQLSVDPAQSQQKEFGDLIAAFTQKNPVNGFSMGA